jgi:hypothetical protein
VLFVDAKDHAALDNLWWAESADEGKTRRDTGRHLGSDDAVHLASITPFKSCEVLLEKAETKKMKGMK